MWPEIFGREEGLAGMEKGLWSKVYESPNMRRV